jgi:hypothetical protein
LLRGDRITSEAKKNSVVEEEEEEIVETYH